MEGLLVVLELPFVGVAVWSLSDPERAARYRMEGYAGDPEPTDRHVLDVAVGRAIAGLLGVVLIAAGLLL